MSAWLPELLAIIGGVAGLAWAALLTWLGVRNTTEDRSNLENRRLQITTKDGRLIGMINLDAIDKEDPKKLDRILAEIQKAKEDTPAS
jgi:hypothetical protein